MESINHNLCSETKIENKSSNTYTIFSALQIRFSFKYFQVYKGSLTRKMAHSRKIQNLATLKIFTSYKSTSGNFMFVGFSIRL